MNDHIKSLVLVRVGSRPGFFCVCVPKISSRKEKEKISIRLNERTSAKYDVVCDTCVVYMPACVHTPIHIQADLIL